VPTLQRKMQFMRFNGKSWERFGERAGIAVDAKGLTGLPQ